MLEVGMILKFIPPYYADGKHNDERTKRFMLIVSINYEEGILVLINISKVDGKPDCLTYDYNKLITTEPHLDDKTNAYDRITLSAID